MTTPVKGQRITASWAQGLQVRNAMPVPVDGARTSTGVIAAPIRSDSVSIIARNGSTALSPWTLIGLDTVSPAISDDGRLVLQVTTSRSKLIACTGPSTVPIGGQFTPWLFDSTPIRVKAKSSDYWAEGIPCGREPGGSQLTSREGGLLCVKVPDTTNHAWVVSDFNAIWTGALVGPVGASSDPIDPGINGIVAVIKQGVVTNQRLDLCSCSDVALEDGLIVTVGYTDRWSLLWANCGPTAGAEDLTPVPVEPGGI